MASLPETCSLTRGSADSVLKDTGSLEGPVPSSFFGVTLNSYLDTADQYCTASGSQ